MIGYGCIGDRDIAQIAYICTFLELCLAIIIDKPDGYIKLAVGLFCLRFFFVNNSESLCFRFCDGVRCFDCVEVSVIVRILF